MWINATIIADVLNRDIKNKNKNRSICILTDWICYDDRKSNKPPTTSRTYHHKQTYMVCIKFQTWFVLTKWMLNALSKKKYSLKKLTKILVLRFSICFYIFNTTISIYKIWNMSSNTNEILECVSIKLCVVVDYLFLASLRIICGKYHTCDFVALLFFKSNRI